MENNELTLRRNAQYRINRYSDVKNLFTSVPFDGQGEDGEETVWETSFRFDAVCEIKIR